MTLLDFSRFALIVKLVLQNSMCSAERYADDLPEDDGENDVLLHHIVNNQLPTRRFARQNSYYTII